MARETWREYYGALIDRAAEEGRRGGLSGIELRRYIRGQTHPGRHGIAGAWGLKMWQQEMRVFRGLPKRKRSSTPSIADLPGQLRLFED